jgi:catechol 2,3-dioxygenase-like lactoylglutathione lyase family enzyme
VRIDRIDHLVLTIADIERTVAFYVDVLGMTRETFGSGRTALSFGGSKLNLHQLGRELDPKAAAPTPGSADLCLMVSEPLEVVVGELTARGVTIEEGPVERTGARGPIVSVYVRDPDGNLVELSNESPGRTAARGG